MLEYVMLMKGSAASGDWDDYIEKLVSSGKFRGRSSLGNRVSVAKGKVDGGGWRLLGTCDSQLKASRKFRN